MLENLSSAASYALVTDNNNIGGYTFDSHLNDAVSLKKIRNGGWDFVVLQEQSQVPTIGYYRYNSMYPSGKALSDTIRKYNPCASIITYMTWGRRFGGQQCDPNNTYCSPAFRDFGHMQDSLTSAYRQFSNLIGAMIAPIGEAWRKVLAGSAFVLHVSDNSHPTVEGSYVAACVLFGTIWKKQSSGNSYTAGLPKTTAAFLQQKSDSTFFNNGFDWNVDIDQPKADFTYSFSGIRKLSFLNRSYKAVSVHWDFGDGDTSTDANPTHAYLSNGIYKVNLFVEKCGRKDSIVKSVTIGSLPVRFYETTISNQQRKPCLTWLVGQSQNVSRFDIQRASDTLDFSTVATIAASGTDRYKWYDEAVPTGKQYYRILAIDLEGRSFASQTLIGDDGDNFLPDIIIAPNPVTNGKITVRCPAFASGPLLVEVFDAQGRKVSSLRIDNCGSNNSFSLSAHFCPGMYRLVATSSKGRKASCPLWVE